MNKNNSLLFYFSWIRIGTMLLVSSALSSSIVKPGSFEDTHTPDQQRLLKAVRKGDGHLVVGLLAAGVDTEIRDREGCTPLMIASSYGHIGIMHMLIQYGADKEARCLLECTPLIGAISSKHSQAVAFLLKKGVNKECMNFWHNSAWMIAVAHWQSDIIALLVQAGVDRTHKNKNGVTGLILAAQLGRTREIITLFKLNQVHRQPSPLMQAVCASDAPEVQRLLDDPTTLVNEIDDQGDTALLYAIYVGRSDIIALLLQHAAINTGWYNNDGYNALILAIMINRPCITRLLCMSDAIDINAGIAHQ